MTFTELKIAPPILKALDQACYKHPTPIQVQAIPPAILGRDLLGCAQTGTGKTAAFAVPTLQRLMQTGRTDKRRIRSLILTPTRELALQIHESLMTYGRHTGLRSCVIFGGVSQKQQEIELRQGVDILVATPGRLLDLLGQKLVSLQDVEILTLDEADRMLDMGFIHDVKRIIAQVPVKRQTLFFSATMPEEIVKLSNAMLIEPVHVSISPESPTVEKIQQSVYFVDKINKRHLLSHLLSDQNLDSVLVFTRTKHGADRVARDLARDHVSAQAIHGNKSQNARQRALNDFKNKATRVLVATDIAARGIDIDGLNYVVNFDLPEVPETYVHRIGRSGRAGNHGISLSFCDFEEKKLLKDIEKLIVKSIPVVDDHPYPLTITTIEPKQAPVGRQSRQPRTPRQPRPSKQSAEQASYTAGAERPSRPTPQHRNERSSVPVQPVQTERRPQPSARSNANRPQERQPYAPARQRPGR
ncbi:MAG: DEAD/DEAH box helicase [Clostridia bacterium]|nr:DEAD/DEAH box helicase [Clostridia bacterium]